jgi:hypothetical protein
MKIAQDEQTSVGEIRYIYTFGQPEIKALRLLLSESADLSTQFYNLWSDVLQYDNASFGLKELMPTIVNRLQKKTQINDLEPILKNDYLMLQSLPKYTWTKNWYARNQFLQIAEQLKHAEIDFVLIKGIAETFLDADALNARTCRDIDILIHPSQIEQFALVVADLGWKCKDVTPETLAEPNAFEGNAFTFRQPNGIVDLDVHFSEASLSWSAHKYFVQKIWLEAQRTHTDFLIPSDQCRLLMSAWNIFDIENIKSEQILKYFYDLLRETKFMSAKSKLAFIKNAKLNLNFGKQALWLMVLDAQINKNWYQFILFRLMFFVRYSFRLRFRIRTTEQIYYWLYHTKNIVQSRFNTRLSWPQMLYRTVVESDTYRARRDSYASIMKTKRDNMRSSLLSSYWQLKNFLIQRNRLTFQSMKKIIKKNMSACVNFSRSCTHSFKKNLIKKFLSTHKNIPCHADLLVTQHPDAKISRVKKLYFFSSAYFHQIPVQQNIKKTNKFE